MGTREHRGRDVCGDAAVYAGAAIAATAVAVRVGKRERIRALLGNAFDLKFEDGTSVFRLPSGAAAWDLMSTSYGPTKTLTATLDAGRCEQLRQAFVAYHDKFSNDVGMTVPREYLLTLGVRR